MTGYVKYKFLFAGGGTGGHLYPAIAVAEELRKLKKESEFLFVGTKTKIESRVIPKLGYNFKPIWISGFSRKLTLKNILFPLKVIISALQSLFISVRYRPKVAIGTGAYVSGPAIWAAKIWGAKIVLLEQNSFPGITNRLLERKADEIHLAFEDSKKYFRNKNKLYLSGNPIRSNLKIKNREESLRSFGLAENMKTIFILGGSLGAEKINSAVEKFLPQFKENKIQLLWQTGELYYSLYHKYDNNTIRVLAFIDNMEIAYSAADLVVCRAGATTIAEVSALHLPVIFVPSSNVAANHQYKNAKSILDAGGAKLITDNEILDKLFDEVISVINDQNKLAEMKEKIAAFSNADAALKIAERIIQLSERG